MYTKFVLRLLFNVLSRAMCRCATAAATPLIIIIISKRSTMFEESMPVSAETVFFLLFVSLEELNALPLS